MKIGNFQQVVAAGRCRCSVRQSPCHRASESGNALMLSMLLVVYFSVLVGSSISVTQTVANNAGRSIDFRRAQAIAEGHSEYAFGVWRERVRDQIAKIATGSEPADAELTWNDLKDMSLPPGGLFPAANYTVDTFEVRPIEPVLDQGVLKELSGDIKPAYAVGQYGNASSVFYLAKTDITMPTRNGSVNVSLRRILEKERENPALYAIFFDGDCEMHPGPSQIVDGWVHTNASLYTAHSSLKFNERVTYSDDWLLDYHPADTIHGGSPSKPSWESTPKNGAARDLFGYDPNRVFDKYDDDPSNDDENPNNDSYIELIQKAKAGYDDPFSNERFYNKADLVIEVVTPNATTAPDGFLVKDKSGNVLQGPVYAAVRDSLSKSKFRDNRIGGEVQVTNLDISKLNTLINDPTALPDWGGVIWISDMEANPSSGDHRAVRLLNGGVLPDRTMSTGDERDGQMIGLTIVSENPVYIQGDFNTGTVGTSKPVSSGNTTKFEDFRDKNMVSGYEFRPAAIVADAVNILSNAWSDANADKSRSSRKASNTTVNAAIVSGIVPTGEYDANNQYVSYSGGVENFPRFLEDWSGKYFTFHGSMIQLYRSHQAFYRWGKSNVYNPPNRRWFYEKNFVQNPPPSFPFTYKMSMHVWYQQ